VQLFNSATRIRKEPRSKSVIREPQGVQFLMDCAQPGNTRRTGAIVAFTSANPGEGVSHVVQFFAGKLASQMGKPTLVLTADRLRSLGVTDLMNIPGMQTKVGNLWTVPAEVSGHGNGNGNGHANRNGNGNGHGNGNAGKLRGDEQVQYLESKSGVDLLQSFGAIFDYTLIDCPSISSSHEISLLAPNVDGVVLVVQADRTKRDQIFRAKQTIEMAKGNLMGLVLNRRRHVVPEWFFRRL
jgi:Mrp family chromosome partitioning ATPase